MNLIYLNQYERKDSQTCPDKRRNFSAKFKSDLVIELLKGEKDFNTLAVENNIQPNLLRNWKKEFLSNASVVFDDKREAERLIAALKQEQHESKVYTSEKRFLTGIGHGLGQREYR